MFDSFAAKTITPKHRFLIRKVIFLVDTLTSFYTLSQLPLFQIPATVQCVLLPPNIYIIH